MPDTDTKSYKLAHPLDAKIQRGSRTIDNPLNRAGKDLAPGDTVELDTAQASLLARAGYLELDDDGEPKVVTAAPGAKDAAKAAAPAK